MSNYRPRPRRKIEMTSRQLAQKKWRDKNPNYKKEYYAKNKDRLKEYNKQYDVTHKLQRKISSRNYRVNNPDKMKLHSQRKLSLRRAGGELPIKRIQQVYEDNIKHYGTLTCYLCLESIIFRNDHLEHKTPLSRGGTNEYDNLGVSCIKCNRNKGVKTEQEYREVLR